jgi:hypothetical protein
VLGEHRVELLDHADTGINDHALLTGRGGDHVAVRPEGLGGYGRDEHASSLAASAARAGQPPPKRALSSAESSMPHMSVTVG